MPETESEWDPESLEQNLPAEAGLWPSDFCLMHLALMFFKEMFSTDKCVLLKLPLIWHCVILEQTFCGGILLTQAFVMVFKNKCSLFSLNQFGN